MLDVGVGRFTWRRLRSLIARLPRESETVRDVHPQAEWGANEHLLAHAVDQLALANWQRVGDKKLPRPTPMRRPGEQSERSTLKPTPSEMHRKLLEQRRRHRR